MKKHFLSICAIVRFEAPYLAEWIRFHLLQGVEHFYIYHNSKVLDDMKTYSVLADFKDKVTLTLWPYFPGQSRAYNNFIRRFKHETEWCAFIDADEFLYSKGGYLLAPDSKELGGAEQSLPERVQNLERVFGKDVDQILVHWLLFGSNGEIEYEDRPVIGRFFKRAAAVNQHVKSICRLKNCISPGLNPHYFRVRGRSIEEYGRDVSEKRGLIPGGTAELLAINHYHVKSKLEYFDRKTCKADANSGRKYTREELEKKFELHDVNEVEDTYLRDKYLCLLQP